MDNNQNQNIIPYRNDRGEPEPPRPDIDREHHWREQGDILEDGVNLRIRVGFLMSEELEKYFKNAFPNLKLMPSASATPHSHARLAFERSYGEGIMWAQMPDGYITDIGGNARRHHDRRRLRVHCCCPILSPEDATRVARYQGLRNWCHNKFQDCHVRVDTYMAVHSLYYLDPEDVVFAVRTSNNHRLYSLHHMFPDAYGCFAEGEAQYMVDPDMRITMYSRGNITPYHHASVSWLNTGYFQSADGVSAIAWSIIQSLPNSVIMLFTPAPRGIPLQPSIGYRGFKPMLKDSNYYGAVPLTGAGFHSALDKAASVELVNSTIHIDTLYSYGKFVLGVDSDRTESCIVPKGFVDEMAAWTVLKARDPTTLSSMIAQARMRIKAYNLPPHLISKAIIFGVALGYTLHLDTESAVMTTVLRDNASRFPVINALLKLDMPYKLPNWVGLVLSIIPALPLLKWRNLHTASSAIVGSTLFVVFMVRQFRFKSRPTPQQQYLNAMQERETTHTNFTMPDYGIIPLDANVLVKGTVGEKPIKPLHPAYEGGPCPVVSDFSDKIDVPKESLTGGGILFPEYSPNINANCPANDRRALFNRGLDVRAYPNANYDELSELFVEINYELLFPMAETHLVYNFSAWNDRFPAATKKRHQQIYDLYGQEIEDEHRATRLKSFMKMEMLLNATPTEYAESDPRLIQGCQDEFNVVVGPWVWAFSKALTRVWNKDSPIYYSAGSTGEEIGEWFDQLGHNNPDYRDSETDFSRYDSTQSRSKLRRSLDVMGRFGIPAFVLRLMWKATIRRGATPNGFVYWIEGTMASGSPDTSSGNSMSNAIDTVLNLAICNPGIKLKELLGMIKLIVLGDDNALRRRSFLAPLSPEVYAMAGLRSELVLRENSYDLTFCSSRFWPTSHGTILGPKVSRMMAKLGWTVNTPEHLVKGVLRSKVLSLEASCAFIPPLKAILETMKRLTSRDKPVDRYTERSQYLVKVRAQPVAETWHMLDYLHSWTSTDHSGFVKLLAQVKHLPCVLTGDLLAKFIQADGEFPLGANLLQLLHCVYQDRFFLNTIPLLTSIFVYVVSPCIEEMIKRIRVGKWRIGLLFPLVEYYSYCQAGYPEFGNFILVFRLLPLAMHYYWFNLPFPWACILHLLYNLTWYVRLNHTTLSKWWWDGMI